MIKFHAVMIDETGCEFGADVEADNRQAAYDLLRENYPESRCVQLESPEDTKARESQMDYDIRHGIERDEDGRITHIEPGYNDEPDEDEEGDPFDDETEADPEYEARQRYP